MANHYNPRIVTSNLALNLDFRNPKRFTDDLGSGNLVQNFNYNPSTWNAIFSENNNITTGIYAPDGSKSAVRFSCFTTGSSLLRVTFTPFTPNGTDEYGISFWARKISGATSSNNTLTSDIQDNISYNYVNDLETGKWKRIFYKGTLPNTSMTFIDLLSNNTNDYVIDFWGIKIENLTANNSYPFKDTISNSQFSGLNGEFIDMSQDYITLRRNIPPDAEDGGYFEYTTSGNLTAANYLHNDHTTEVWFKPIERDPTNYNVNETSNAIVLFRGFHSMWYYNATSYTYGIWGQTSGVNGNYTLSISDTEENVWTQLVAVRSGNTLKLYKNGILKTSGTISSGTDGIPTTNELKIGIGNYNNLYSWHSYMDFASLKMYKKALSDSEVLQNFNAIRGRFGI